MRVISAVIGLIAAFQLCVCRAENVPEKIEIKIGVIVPLTGVMAQSGQAFREAALMGLEDEPAGLKYKYRLIFEDDQLGSKQAATAAQKLIAQDQVDALISTWSYGGSVVAPLAQRSKVPHFSVAWAHEIAAGEYNFLHLTPPKSFVPKILDVLERRGLKRIATFAIAEAGSIYALNEIERLAPTRGFEVVARSEALFTETDFKQSILREMAKNPDALYVNLIGGQFDLFMTQLRELRFKIPVVAQTALSTVNDLHPYDGFWYVSDAYFPEQALEDRLVQRVKHHNTLYSANFYDSVRALIHAYEHAAAAPAQKPNAAEFIVKKDLFANFKSIFPSITIDGDGVFNYEPRYYQVQDGKSVPSDLETILKAAW